MVKPTKVETIDLRMEAGDTLWLETQHDERRGTVLYIHVNGVTVVRVQNLSPRDGLPPILAKMKGREDV